MNAQLPECLTAVREIVNVGTGTECWPRTAELEIEQ